MYSKFVFYDFIENKKELEIKRAFGNIIENIKKLKEKTLFQDNEMFFYSDFGQVLLHYSTNILFWLKLIFQEFLFSSVKSFLSKKKITLWNIGTPKINKLGVIEAIIRYPNVYFQYIIMTI